MNDIATEKEKEKAVELSLNGKFDEASIILRNVLERTPEDTDALLQLAHCNMQSGNLKEAQKLYKLVVRLEPNNLLAQKKLLVITSLLQKNLQKVKRNCGRIIPITYLIEEPGKAKIVRLSTIGKTEDISRLNIGEEVFLKIRKRKIEVRDADSNFVGYLPDDISKRLTELMNGECKYEAFIFVVDKNECKIFVREIKKAHAFSSVSSFPLDVSLLHEEEEEEEEEEDSLDLDSEDTIIHTEEDLTSSDRTKRKKTEEEEEEEEEEADYNEYEE
ncbi:MAG: tetratricopeptide repeat protein [Candidatus Roizmanbacteria bacterium]|nr:tetratricopeptide repeat protein [Candidatus Roizmanbacteria bacterium]